MENNEVRNMMDTFKVIKDLGYTGTALRDRMQYHYFHENLHRANSPYKPRRRYDVQDKRNTLAAGHKLGKIIAQVNKLADKQVTDTDNLIILCNYMDFVYRHLPYEALSKAEPNVRESRNRFSEGYDVHWLPVPLDKLLPQGVDDDIKFRFNDRREAIHLVHFLHVSVDDPTQVAYYPSLRHRREGREVRTKLGRYLTAYADFYGLTETIIKTMVEKHNAIQAASKNWQVRFIESNDPNGWVRVYDTRDVTSCMRGNDAVRVYAHDKSVLRLAYLATVNPRTDEEMNIIARCIVRDDDEKGWLRVYPDHNGHSEGRFLLDYLNANGYPNRIGLEGVLLQCIEDSDGYGYVCPYIDFGAGSAQSVNVIYKEGKHYLAVTENGEHDAASTNGYTEPSGCSCDECGDRYHEDDMHYVECTGYTYCTSCYEDNFVYGYNGRHKDDIPRDDAVYVDGNYYHVDCLADHDIYYCEKSDEYYHIDDLTHTPDGYVHNRYTTNLDFTHAGEYDYAVTEDTKELPDGKVCHKDDYEEIMAEHYSDDEDGQTDNVSECPAV